MGRHEGIAEQEGPHAGPHRDHQPQPDPAHGQDGDAAFDKAHVGGQVLQQQPDGKAHAAREAPARQVVSAQEQVHRQRHRQREHPLHDDRGDQHHEVVAGGLALGLALTRAVEGGQLVEGLLRGQRHAFGGGAEAAQQRIAGQRHDPQHRDLAQRVEGAEVHKDHVDGVRPSALGIGVAAEPVADGGAGGRGHHRECDGGDAGPAGARDHKVDRAAAPGGQAVVTLDLAQALGQPAQAQQQKDGCHDLDQDLGHGQVGGRQPGEGHGRDQPRAAQQRQRGEAVILGLDRRPDGAGDPRHPEQRKGRVEALQQLARDKPGEAPQRRRRGRKAQQHDQAQLHLQPGAAQDAVQPGRPPAGERQHQPVEDLLAADARQDARRLVGARQPRRHDEVKDRTQHQGRQAHHQGDVEAVPQREAVIGGVPAKDRQHAGMQDRADHGRGPQPDQKDDGDQQLDRAAHPDGGLVGFLRQVRRGRPEEDRHDEAQRIGHAEDAGEGGDIGQRVVQPGAVVPVGGLGEEHLLGQEAVQKRHAPHGGGGDDGQRRRARHGMAQAAEPAHVAGAGLVVDDARGHEQRGLEDRVVHDVEDRGHDRPAAADARQGRDQAEVADRRIGQQPLEVVAPGGDHRAQQKRRHARARDHPEPGGGAAEDRREADKKKDARLHHRGRMQVGADGRGRGHRVRQPEMERELRRLGEGSQQEQAQDPAIPGMRPHAVARPQHVVQVIAAGGVPQQDHRHQQAEAPGPGHDQRRARALAGGAVLVPVADQQEGKEARQFPEHHHQDDVARHQHPRHRPREGQQEAVEARHGIVVGQVVAGVDDDQQPDPVDQQQHQPGKAVHPQRDIQPQRGRPFDAAGDHSPVRDLPRQGRQSQQARHHHGPRQQHLGVAGAHRHGDGQDRAQERQHCKQKEKVLAEHASGVSPFFVMAARRARGSFDPMGRAGNRRIRAGKRLPRRAAWPQRNPGPARPSRAHARIVTEHAFPAQDEGTGLPAEGRFEAEL